VEVRRDKNLSSLRGIQSPFLSQCRRLFAIPNELSQLTTIAKLHLNEWKLCTLTTHTQRKPHIHTHNSLRKDLLWFLARKRGLHHHRNNEIGSIPLVCSLTPLVQPVTTSLLSLSPRNFKVTRLYRQ